MSIKVISLVWDCSKLRGTELLAMLALADWGSDDGSRIYPSIKSIAKKIRVTDRQAQRVLHKLIDEGYLTVVKNHDGGYNKETRHYQMNLNKLSTTGEVDVTPKNGRVTFRDETGDIQGGARVTSRALTGDMGVTQSVREPLSKPLEEPLVSCSPKSGEPKNDNSRIIYCEEDTPPPNGDDEKSKALLEGKAKTSGGSEVAEQEFEIFYEAYPKKQGRQNALREWLDVKPDLDEVLTALEWQKETDQWDEMQFIPLPASYINGKRWEDQPSASAVSGRSNEQGFLKKDYLAGLDKYLAN